MLHDIIIPPINLNSVLDMYYSQVHAGKLQILATLSLFLNSTNATRHHSLDLCFRQSVIEYSHIIHESETSLYESPWLRKDLHRYASASQLRASGLLHSRLASSSWTKASFCVSQLSFLPRVTAITPR